ncbi:MAG TPA: hypothetical protein VGG32_01000 [Thermoplasmata archaeon]|jgi:hypothetical protein
MVTNATRDKYEDFEVAFWQAQGFSAEKAWKHLRGLIRTPKGLLPRLERRDFLATEDRAGFDVMAVCFAQPIAAAYVQVTSTPFVQARSGKEDRNAAHGPPPFAWPPPKRTVEEWISDVMTDTLFEYEDPALVQVIASYAEGPRHVDRRWWYSDRPNRTSA